MISAPAPRQTNFISQADAIKLMVVRLQDVRKALEAPIGGRKR